MVEPEGTDGLFAHFLDVGQGDCTIIVDELSRRAVLIDCTAGGVRSVLRALRARRIETLDVIVTHWDYDHYPGAIRVAKSFPARKLYFNLDTVRPADQEHQDRRQATLRSLQDVPRDRTEFYSALEGATGSTGRVQWMLLAPDQREILEAHNGNDRNHGSAIIYVYGGGTDMLIGGDADGRVWNRLLTSARLPTASVLRCSHHGGGLGTGKDSVDEQQLLDAVQPRALIISTGTANSYGHPFPGVVAAARRRGVRVMCTEATPRCRASLPGPHVCAGPVTVSIPSGALTPNKALHDERMRSLVPMCKATPEALLEGSCSDGV